MTPSEIQPLLQADSFRPMKIVTTRNGTFEVMVLSHLLLTATQLYIGREINDVGVPTKVSAIPLLQIMRLEPMS